MPFNDVTNLRKEGKLEEALQMALSDYQQNSENIWNKRALAWVYYDFSKKYANENNLEEFLQIIQKIKELALPKDEKMIFDNLVFSYHSLFKNIYQKTPIDYNKAQKMKASLSGLYFTFPSENFSILISDLHKTFKESNDYTLLAEKSFFNFLRQEDFLPTEYNNQKIMPLAEQIYTNYCKMLVKGEVLNAGNDNFISQYEPNKEKIKDFLPTLQQWIDNFPNYTYLPYFKAKMEILLGDDALKTFLPFAKKKRNDYWVWQLMSEILQTNENQQFACLCKALSLKTQEQFLGNIRIQMAEKFIEKALFNEAKTEIEFVIAEKTKNQQKIPMKIQQWTNQEWYQKATKNNSNYFIYKKYIPIAESILFSDIEEEIVVVQNLNTDKKILNFIKNKQKIGFFKYENILKNPKIGDILKVRLETKENGFYKLLTAEIDNQANSSCLKKFAGTIKISPKGFGFVEDTFISAEIIKKQNLQNGQFISGKAILSFDKKKENWSWSGVIL